MWRTIGFAVEHRELTVRYGDDPVPADTVIGWLTQESDDGYRRVVAGVLGDCDIIPASDVDEPAIVEGVEPRL